MEDASNLEDATPLGGSLSPRCTHILEQIVKKLIKLRVDEAISLMMKELEEILSCQRTTSKVTYKRLSVKDKT